MTLFVVLGADGGARTLAFAQAADIDHFVATPHASDQPQVFVATPVMAPLPREPWMDGNDGPFAIGPGGALPTDAECAKRVAKTPEAMASNGPANHYVGNARQAVAKSGVGPYAERITGNFKGTTDEIIQWASCKWGFDPAPVRAQALVESSLHQTSLGGFVIDDGSCVDTSLRRVAEPPTDASPTSTTTTTEANVAAAGFGVHADAPPQLSSDTSTSTSTTTPQTETGYECPTAFGLLQIRSDYHPGTYPLSAKSTAFNLDYSLAMKRACYDGISFLGAQTKGDAWGCVGAHYAGAWRTTDALDYIAKVKARLPE